MCRRAWVPLSGRRLQLQAAHDTAVEALRLHPGSIEARVALAAVAEIRQSRDAAARLYRQVLAADPDHTDALLGLARVSQNMTVAVTLTRAAQGDVADDPRTMGQLVRLARARLFVAYMVFLAPVALAGTRLIDSIELRDAMYLAFVCSAVVSLGASCRMGARIARKWAVGQGTWWLFDRRIASGRARTKQAQLLLAVPVILIGLVVACVVLLGGTEPDGPHGSLPPELTAALDTDGPVVVMAPRGWDSPDIATPIAQDDRDPLTRTNLVGLGGIALAGALVVRARWHNRRMDAQILRAVATAPTARRE